MFACGLPSWGSHKPRTRKAPQPATEDSALAAAAAAAAEAETAAVKAVAQALIGGRPAVGSPLIAPGLMSDTEALDPSRRLKSSPKDTTRRWHPSQHPPSAQRKRQRSLDCDTRAVQHGSSTDQSRKHQLLQHKPRRCTEHDNDNSKQDCSAPIQWHAALTMHPNGSNSRHAGSRRAGSKATPKGPYKPHDYLGSRFCGVNGIQHTPDSLLRWRAGTWDPVLKKTVYIGSYRKEVAAAAAVDAWHASHGRPPVNFPSIPPAEKAAAEAAEAADACKFTHKQARGHRLSGYGSDVSGAEAPKHLERRSKVRGGIRSPQDYRSEHNSLDHRPRYAFKHALFVLVIALCLVPGHLVITVRRTSAQQIATSRLPHAWNK